MTLNANVLLTGASGYLGGSVLRYTLDAENIPYPKSNLHAIVRKEEHVTKLAEWGVHAVIVPDLKDKDAVKKAVKDLNIHQVVHAADSLFVESALSLLEGLSDVKAATGKAVSFVHISGSSAYSPVTGWNFSAPSDVDDDVTAMEKKTNEEHPYSIRSVDVAVHETGEKLGINTYIVCGPMIYGRGTGPYNRLSIQIPALITTARRNREVRSFNDNSNGWPLIHIKDFSSFVSTVSNAALSPSPPKSGGTYFASAGHVLWTDIIRELGQVLHERGLVDHAAVARPWKDGEEMADVLGMEGLVRAFAPIAVGSNVEWIAKKGEAELGWKPKRVGKESLLQHLDEELDAMLAEEELRGGEMYGPMKHVH